MRVRLPRAVPSSTGTAAAGVHAFLDALERAHAEVHSLMIVRHGSVIAEGWWHPYTPETPRMLYSLSKSFTAMAVGIAQDEGLLDIRDRLADHLPQASGYGTATIRDALRMSTGHLMDVVLDPSGGEELVTEQWLLGMLERYLPERAPGEVFTYDQLATFALAKIVERVSGQLLIDYLRPRLLDPIGATEATWVDLGGGGLGFSGLFLATESIAAFGQLLLQRGEWEGRQLVSARWIDEATAVQMPNDSEHRYPPEQPVDTDGRLGYGYQFWASQHGYRADGAYGQFCIVLPEHDAVIALTASTLLTQPVLDAVWATVVPAFDLGGTDADDATLKERLARLSVPAPIAGLPEVAAALAQASLSGVAAALIAIGGSEQRWGALAAEAPMLASQAQDATARVWSARVPLSMPDGSSPPLRFTRTPVPARGMVRFGGIGGSDLPELDGVRLEGHELVLETGQGEVRSRIHPDHFESARIHGIPFVLRGGLAPWGHVEVELRMVQTPHVGYLSLQPSDQTFSFTWREPTLHGRGLHGYAA